MRCNDAIIMHFSRGNMQNKHKKLCRHLSRDSNKKTSRVSFTKGSENTQWRLDHAAIRKKFTYLKLIQKLFDRSKLMEYGATYSDHRSHTIHFTLCRCLRLRRLRDNSISDKCTTSMQLSTQVKIRLGVLTLINVSLYYVEQLFQMAQLSFDHRLQSYTHTVICLFFWFDMDATIDENYTTKTFVMDALLFWKEHCGTLGTASRVRITSVDKGFH